MKVRSVREVGMVVKSARKAAGLTQIQLANEVGVEAPWISLVENGKVNLQVDSLLRILNVLKVGLDMVPPGAKPSDEQSHTQEDDPPYKL